MNYTVPNKCFLLLFFSPSKQYSVQHRSHFRLREIRFAIGDMKYTSVLIQPQSHFLPNKNGINMLRGNLSSLLLALFSGAEGKTLGRIAIHHFLFLFETYNELTVLQGEKNQLLTQAVSIQKEIMGSSSQSANLIFARYFLVSISFSLASVKQA